MTRRHARHDTAAPAANANSGNCFSKSIDTILLKPKRLYINGTILSGNQLIKGKLELYKTNKDSSLTLLDSIKIDNGYYHLEITEDSLQILFIPEENSNYAPQYLTGDLFPSSGDLIIQECGEIKSNININKLLSYGDSSSFISFNGQLFWENPANKTESEGTPKSNTLIYLLNENKRIVDFTYTDNNGKLEFEIDPNLQYLIAVNEVLIDAFETIPSTDIALYKFIISNSQLTFLEKVALNTKSISLNFKIYPNPVKKGETISIKNSIGKIIVSITDLNGKEIFKTTSFGNIKIPTDKLSFGFYNIYISNNKISEVSKIIIN